MEQTLTEINEKLNIDKLKEAQEYWSKVDNIDDFVKSMKLVYENKLYVSPWKIIPVDERDVAQKRYQKKFNDMIASGFYVAISQPGNIGSKFRTRAYMEGPILLSILRNFIIQVLNRNPNAVIVCSTGLKFQELDSKSIQKIPKFKYSKNLNIAFKTIEEDKVINAIIYYKPLKVGTETYKEIPSICAQTNSIHLTEISKKDRILVPTRYWLSINSNVNLNYITNLKLLKALQEKTTWIHVIDQRHGSNTVFDDVHNALGFDNKFQEIHEDSKLIQKKEEISQPSQIFKFEFETKSEPEPKFETKSEPESYSTKSIQLWKNRKF